MSSSSFKSNFYYIAPYAVVAMAYATSSLTAPVIENNQLLFGYSPYLLLGFAALLSLQFNRGRVLLASVVLGAGYYGLQIQNLGVGLAPLNLILSIQIPIFLAVIALLGERGVFSTQVYLLSIVLAVLIFLNGWLLGQPAHQVWLLLDSKFFEINLFPGLYLSQPAIACAALAGLILLVALCFKRDTLGNALIVILLAVALSLNAAEQQSLQIIMFIICGLMLLVSLLQDSYYMAYRDELTGLLGRRALNEAMAKLGRRYVIAMLDVDKFKKFNDTYGHDVGDQVLKMVASQLTKATGGAKAYRYGGEEFTLLFPRKSLKQVKPHLEAVRESIAEYSMSLRGPKRPKVEKEGRKQRSRSNKKGEVSVTISIGAAQRGDGLKSSEQVIKAADKALYQAKKKGRNKVICGK